MAMPRRERYKERAHAVAFPATGMKHDENDDSAGMLLKMPKKPDRPPNVLLGSVKCDPQANFIAKPERHPIASGVSSPVRLGSEVQVEVRCLGVGDCGARGDRFCAIRSCSAG